MIGVREDFSVLSDLESQFVEYSSWSFCMTSAYSKQNTLNEYEACTVHLFVTDSFLFLRTAVSKN